MISVIRSMFGNKDKELELKERELALKEKELEILDKQLKQNKEVLDRGNFEAKLFEKEKKYKEKFEESKKKPVKSQKKEYTSEDKKAYAQRMKDIKEKGKEFEEFVAGHFKLDGYDIYLNGIKKGKKDKGIDIICTKDDELILIQCKNWKENSTYKINHEKLKAFVGCCTDYVNEHNLFHKKLKLKFISSNYILDDSGKKYLEESKVLQYEIFKY